MRRNSPSLARDFRRKVRSENSRGTDDVAQRDQSALMRLLKRDSLRAAVFLCTTPLPTLRCSSGCANLRADCAVARSPVAIAVSTFFTKVRTRLTRARLMAVRLAVCRMRFSADL